VKVRGTTGFSFTTSLPHYDVARAVEQVVDTFAASESLVRARNVEVTDGETIRVDLVLGTSSFGEADDTMVRLCEAIVQRFDAPDGQLVVRQEETELVPA